MIERRLAVGDGVELQLMDRPGDGRPTVLLHGLAGDAAEWLPTVGRLRERRAVLVDQRGHGRSTRAPADVSRSAFTADAIAVIERLGEPVALVGQSMGAHTAMLAAAARPDLVDRLVLLEGGAGGEDPDGAAAVAGWFESWPDRFDDPRAAEGFLGSGALPARWLAALRPDGDRGLLPPFEPRLMARIATTLTVPRWQEWESVVAPVTAVFAADGMFDEARRRELVARGRDVRRVDLAAGSHDAHLDDVEEWAAVLDAALSEDRARP